MQIIHHLTIDLARQLPVPPIGAVQSDANTRAVEIALLENGSAWEAPAGITGAVAFRKPDGKKGLYDRLPDGSAAVTITGSTVTAVLAPQVLSCAGDTRAAVVFHDASLNQLATFPFAIRVERNPAAGQAVSNDYYRYSTMEAVSEAVDGFFTKAEEALQVVHDTAAADAPAIVCDSSGQVISVTDASDRTLQGLTLYGRTTQSGTPTPEAPAALESLGAGGVITATVAGKNLVDASKFPQRTNLGITFANTADGGVHVSGTATGYANTLIRLALPKGRYSVSGINSVPTVSFVYVQQIYADGTMKNTFHGGVAEIDGTETEIRYFVQVSPNAAVDTVIYPMLEAGETVTAFEPYKQQQTITISAPNGLPGIPVESGGNYTDADGQQWICDEIDLARGVYVHRVGKVTFDGSENWIYQEEQHRLNPGIDWVRGLGLSPHYVCKPLEGGFFISGSGLQINVLDSRFTTSAEFKTWLASNPLTVLYAHTTPIETPLSAQELAAFAALHSNKPNTTVFNDAGAGMKLRYTADTKTYIDQKLAAISAAMLNA